MSSRIRLGPNRRFPSIPAVTDDPRNHTQVLMALKEAVEVGKRDTTDILNSYVRVRDLVDLGILSLDGGSVSTGEELDNARVVRLGAAFVSPSGALTTSVNPVFVNSPVTGKIIRVRLLTAGGVGSCQIEIRKDSFNNFPPTPIDSIVGSSPPVISGGTSYNDDTLAGWTRDLTQGDVLSFILSSVSVFTYVGVELFVLES
jgi:hypothetical protein